VFVSSHLMSEMENTADHLIVIGRGRIIADCTVREFIETNSQQIVRVRTPQTAELAELVTRDGGKPVLDGDGLLITELPPARVGDLAYDNGIRLHELSVLQASLEQAFMELTRDSVEYHAAVPAAAGES
jgi:ABC-2 type transport system ATP-binding protein